MRKQARDGGTECRGLIWKGWTKWPVPSGTYYLPEKPVDCRPIRPCFFVPSLTWVNSQLFLSHTNLWLQKSWVFEGFGGLHLARRGRCSFAQKSAVSAAAGASALLVADFEASEETDAQVQMGDEMPEKTSKSIAQTLSCRNRCNNSGFSANYASESPLVPVLHFFWYWTFLLGGRDPCGGHTGWLVSHSSGKLIGPEKWCDDGDAFMYGESIVLSSPCKVSSVWSQPCWLADKLQQV